MNAPASYWLIDEVREPTANVKGLSEMVRVVATIAKGVTRDD